MLRVERYEEVEQMLAAIRQSGAAIDEMEFAHTDLEEVFVRIMADKHD